MLAFPDSIVLSCATILANKIMGLNQSGERKGLGILGHNEFPERPPLLAFLPLGYCNWVDFLRELINVRKNWSPQVDFNDSNQSRQHVECLKLPFF